MSLEEKLHLAIKTIHGVLSQIEGIKVKKSNSEETMYSMDYSLSGI